MILATKLLTKGNRENHKKLLEEPHYYQIKTINPKNHLKAEI